MTSFSSGDVSGSQTLTDNDHLYGAHINELRDAVNNKLPYKVVGFNSSCDYVCDGISDDVQIQQAIDDVVNAGGGVIYLQIGTYDIQNTISKSSFSNVVIRGCGGGTILKLGNNVNKNMVSFSSSNNFLLEDLVIDGNRDNQTTEKVGIELGSCYNFRVNRVDFKNVSYIGLSLRNSYKFTVSNCWADNCKLGFWSGGNSNRNKYASWVSCRATNSTADGFTWDGNYSLISNCIAVSNGYSGFYFDPSSDFNTMVNLFAQWNGNYGIDFNQGCDYNTVVGGYTEGNYNAGLNFGGTRCSVSGLISFSDGGDQGNINDCGIRLGPNSLRCNVIGCQVIGSYYGLVSNGSSDYNNIVALIAYGCNIGKSLAGTNDNVWP